MPSRSVVSDSPFHPSRRTVLATAAAGVALVGVAPRARAVEAKKGDSTRHIARSSWAGTDFSHGTGYGVAVSGAGIAFAASQDTVSYTDPHTATPTPRSYEVARWVSPTVPLLFGLTELVASWNASTPGESWIEVLVRGDQGGANLTKQYVLGRWAAKDPADGGGIHRTSLNGQGDTVATVFTDTLATRSGFSLTSYELEVRLYRPVGSSDVPAITELGAMASALPSDKKVPRSPNGPACGTTLNVPTFSQEKHKGHFPQWDNGGEAWCSPTSTSMVVAYWGAGPSAAETQWVTAQIPDESDPQVDFTARNVFDYTYDGAGNWPFNAAYAATRGLRGFVTRLRTLTEAEEFIKAGIPLVASVSFTKGELKGAGYSTNGHLMVIVGFAPNGDVVCNDPASHLIPDNGQVRVTYDREQFENVWAPHSGGIVYVIHPETVALPDAPPEANW
ncbi:peptidase C39 family protein [Intrasporangium mesophilum]